jgi:hypothetical protein
MLLSCRIRFLLMLSEVEYKPSTYNWIVYSIFNINFPVYKTRCVYSVETGEGSIVARTLALSLSLDEHAQNTG